jgi:hypothetical protein
MNGLFSKTPFVLSEVEARSTDRPATSFDFAQDERWKGMA